MVTPVLRTMGLHKMAIRAHNAGVRGRRGIRFHEVVAPPPACRDCADPGAFGFAGDLYCGRCALERLIGALRAEVGAVGDTAEVIDRGEGVLSDR